MSKWKNRYSKWPGFGCLFFFPKKSENFRHLEFLKFVPYFRIISSGGEAVFQNVTANRHRIFQHKYIYIHLHKIFKKARNALHISVT